MTVYLFINNIYWQKVVLFANKTQEKSCLYSSNLLEKRYKTSNN